MENRKRYFVVIVYLLIQSCGSFRHPYVNNRHKIIFYVSDSLDNYIAKQIKINEYDIHQTDNKLAMSKNHLTCVEITILNSDKVKKYWTNGEHEAFEIDFFDASNARREYNAHKHDINHLYKNVPEMLSNRYLSIGNKLYPIYISSLDDYFDNNNPETRNMSITHIRPFILRTPMLIYYYDRLSKGFFDYSEDSLIEHGLKK